jgi:inhibitor of KinA sporulation pathway (predicted exonuclease)
MGKTAIRNVAFFDAEFTAQSAKDRGVQEMIQCAFVVYRIEISDDNRLVSMTDEPIFVYTTFVRPIYNPQLSDYIKELTGISQEDIDSGKDFCDAIEDMYVALKKYRIKKIFTWGPDRFLLKGNCDVLDYNSIKAKTLCNRFYDVSKNLSDMCGYNNIISQHKMCQLFGISEVGEHHNAYYDAINLSKIIKEFYGQCDLSTNR